MEIKLSTAYSTITPFQFIHSRITPEKKKEAGNFPSDCNYCVSQIIFVTICQ